MSNIKHIPYIVLFMLVVILLFSWGQSQVSAFQLRLLFPDSDDHLMKRILELQRTVKVIEQIVINIFFIFVGVLIENVLELHQSRRESSSKSIETPDHG